MNHVDSGPWKGMKLSDTGLNHLPKEGHQTVRGGENRRGKGIQAMAPGKDKQLIYQKIREYLSENCPATSISGSSPIPLPAPTSTRRTPTSKRSSKRVSASFDRGPAEAERSEKAEPGTLLSHIVKTASK